VNFIKELFFRRRKEEREHKERLKSPLEQKKVKLKKNVLEDQKLGRTIRTRIITSV
jgi:ribosomal protein L9